MKISQLDRREQNTITQLAAMTNASPNTQRRRAVFKRGTTLLNADKEVESFEDSRITLLLFEKYKIVELVRFFIIVASVILCIINVWMSFIKYEYSFESVEDGPFSTQLSLLQYIIMIHTIVLVILTVVSYQMKLLYLKEAKMVTKNASIMNTTERFYLYLELLIVIPTVNPYTAYHQSYYQDWSPSSTVSYYFVNEILTFIMMMRVALAVTCILKFTKYYTSQVGRLCRLYSAPHGTHLTFKLQSRENPLHTLGLLLALGMFVFLYALEIGERAKLRYAYPSRESTLGESSFITYISLPSIGYGDQYQYTNLGRISMCLCVYYGVSLSSLFVAALLSLLNPSNGENMSWALLQKRQLTSQIEYVGKRIITELFLLKKRLRTSINIHLDETIGPGVQTIEELFQDMQLLERNRQGIDGEDFLSMVKRYFRNFNDLFETQEKLLKECLRQQSLIQSKISEMKTPHKGPQIKSVKPTESTCKQDTASEEEKSNLYINYDSYLIYMQQKYKKNHILI